VLIIEIGALSRSGGGVCLLPPDPGVTLREMARRAAIRASDEDRELVAERLREATGEGRLLPAELEDRLAAALSARTHGQLAVLVSDLPSQGSGRSSMPIWARATLGVAGAVGVVTAAATAALLFSLIAAVSAVWMVLGRVLGGNKGKRARPEEPSPIRAAASRRSLPRGAASGGGRGFPFS
jgi:hypothetical protein